VIEADAPPGCCDRRDQDQRRPTHCYSALRSGVDAQEFGKSRLIIASLELFHGTLSKMLIV